MTISASYTTSWDSIRYRDFADMDADGAAARVQHILGQSEQIRTGSLETTAEQLEAARKQLSEAGKDLLEATGKVAAKENSLLLARAALAAARTNARARQSAIGAPMPLRIARILANIGLRATPTGGDLCEAHPGAGKIRAAVQIDK